MLQVCSKKVAPKYMTIRTPISYRRVHETRPFYGNKIIFMKQKVQTNVNNDITNFILCCQQNHTVQSLNDIFLVPHGSQTHMRRVTGFPQEHNFYILEVTGYFCYFYDKYSKSIKLGQDLEVSACVDT